MKDRRFKCELLFDRFCVKSFATPATSIVSIPSDGEEDIKNNKRQDQLNQFGEKGREEKRREESTRCAMI